jgi:hypothetical protein
MASLIAVKLKWFIHLPEATASANSALFVTDISIAPHLSALFRSA